MKYIVYLTTNLVNKKIYIGVHKTEDPYKFDNYLGNAVLSNHKTSYERRETPLQCAVAKYGPKNFIRKTIKVFDTLQDALDLERWLVDETFIQDIYDKMTHYEESTYRTPGAEKKSVIDDSPSLDFLYEAND